MRAIRSWRGATRWCARSWARPSISTRRWARRRRARWRNCSRRSMPSRSACARPRSTSPRASAEFFAGLRPRTLALAASAAALAIVLQAGLLAGIVLKEQKAGGYQTASATSDGEPDRQLRADPLPAAGERRRRHQVPRGQQAGRRGRTLGRRALPGAHRRPHAGEGRTRRHDQEAAGRQGRLLHRRDRVNECVRRRRLELCVHTAMRGCRSRRSPRWSC